MVLCDTEGKWSAFKKKGLIYEVMNAVFLYSYKKKIVAIFGTSRLRFVNILRSER